MGVGVGVAWDWAYLIYTSGTPAGEVYGTCERVGSDVGEVWAEVEVRVLQSQNFNYFRVNFFYDLMRLTAARIFAAVVLRHVDVTNGARLAIIDHPLEGPRGLVRTLLNGAVCRDDGIGTLP